MSLLTSPPAFYTQSACRLPSSPDLGSSASAPFAHSTHPTRSQSQYKRTLAAINKLTAVEPEVCALQGGRLGRNPPRGGIRPVSLALR